MLASVDGEHGGRIALLWGRTASGHQYRARHYGTLGSAHDIANDLGAVFGVAPLVLDATAHPEDSSTWPVIAVDSIGSHSLRVRPFEWLVTHETGQRRHYVAVLTDDAFWTWWGAQRGQA